jgi:hypothetical protein
MERGRSTAAWSNKQPLTYVLNTDGTVDLPAATLDRGQALRWVTEHTNKTLGLTEPPEVAGGPPPTDEEGTFLLYHLLYKHGNQRARLTEPHIPARIARLS